MASYHLYRIWCPVESAWEETSRALEEPPPAFCRSGHAIDETQTVILETTDNVPKVSSDGGLIIKASAGSDASKLLHRSWAMTTTSGTESFTLELPGVAYRALQGFYAHIPGGAFGDMVRLDLVVDGSGDFVHPYPEGTLVGTLGTTSYSYPGKVYDDSVDIPSGVALRITYAGSTPGVGIEITFVFQEE